MRRPATLSLVLTGAWLGFWLWPPLWLHARALWAVYLQPAHWGQVSPLAPEGMNLLLRSLALASAVSLGTLVMGVPLGYALARGPRWWKIPASALCSVAISIPPTLAAAPFVAYTTASGTAMDGSLLSFVLSVLTLCGCYAPLVAGCTWLAIAAVPTQEEEAALLLVGEWRAWYTVLGARVWRAALAGALGAAALSLWEMGAPDLLGWPTFSMHVYRNLAAVDTVLPGGQGLPASFGAALVGLPVQLLTALLLVGAWPLLSRVAPPPAAGAGFTFHQPTYLGRLATVPGTCVLLLCPVWLLATFVLSAGLPTSWWGTIAANREAVFNTLLFPGLTALVLPLLSLLLVLGWKNWPPYWQRLAILLACWPLLVTPVVLGTALVEGWNQDWLAAVYDNPLLMALVGYGTRMAPVSLMLALWCSRQIPEQWIWSAAGLGASAWQSFLSITLPLLRIPLLGLAALIFALCAGELTITILIQAPGGATLPVPIFSLLHAGLSGDVAALCLVQSALCGGMLLLGALLLLRRH